MLFVVFVFASCSKKTEAPTEPDSIPVKITAWTISNQFDQLHWNVNVDIDKELDEDVRIQCVFTTYPERTQVIVPIKLPKGWTSWYGVSAERPETINSCMLSSTQTFTISGIKKYKLTYK